MRKPKIFVRLDEEEMIRRIAKAEKRIVYAAPSISRRIATAIGLHAAFKPGLKVDVIVDVHPETLRLGYGDIGALKYLMRSPIGVRCAPGLKIGVLAVDRRSFVFAPAAKIIEDPDADSPNAINIDPTMTDWLLHAMVPKDMILENARREISGFPTSSDLDPDQPGEPPPPTGIEPEFEEEITERESITDLSAAEDGSTESVKTWMEPEIGGRIFQADEMEQLAEDLEQRPPKRFDHEREILVYNGHLRFVKLKFTGGRLSSRTVRLPDHILALAKDRPEMIDVKATCKLFGGGGTGGNTIAAVAGFERRVDEVRRCYTKSLGEELGRVVLVRDQAAFDEEVRGLGYELEDLRISATKRIGKALEGSKKILRKILFPLITGAPLPDELVWMLEHSKRSYAKVVIGYLRDQLDRVFPHPASMIERMDLVCVYKDVTWEMLNDEKFGEAIKRTFPDEEFTNLYLERNTIGERRPQPPREIVEPEDDEWPSEIG